MVIYFVRHGRVENLRGEKYGRRPGFPLSIEGRIEAERAAQSLAGQGIEVVFSSPLLRTSETAQIIQKVLGMPLIFDQRLLEYDDGQETLEDSGRRVFEFLNEVKSRELYKTIAVVSHETPMAVAGTQISRLPSADYVKFCLLPAGIMKLEI
ncbi:MAG: histidine phosphatase family protein [Patescibacteria group bacterium]|nr:histidine phosphatase family protein [Patescibacteria group bacterium]